MTKNESPPYWILVVAGIIGLGCVMGALFPSSKYATQDEVNYVNNLQQERFKYEAEQNKVAEQMRRQEQMNKIQAGYYNR